MWNNFVVVIDSNDIYVYMYSYTLFFCFPELDRQNMYVSREEVAGRTLVSKVGDVLLGVTVIPTMALLTHRTGQYWG
jgi:hypothetical protein